MFIKRELIKTKGAKDWQEEKHIQDSFIEIIRHLQHDELKKQLATINDSSLQNNGAGLPDNPTTTQLIESNRTSEANQQPIILEHVSTNNILEETLKDISKQVLETKYTLNLSQFCE